MTTALVIHSSPLSQGSKTRQLSDTFVAQFKAQHPGAEVIERDLTKTDLPHLDEATIGAFYTPEEQRSEEQKAVLALSDELLAELERAEVIVIGAPMHNFSIPSRLKAYIDQVARVGRTFVYTENGPKGLLEGKRAYILGASGGNYAEGSPLAALNHVEPYLKTVLGFIGITEVEAITASGVSMGEEGFQQAQETVKTLLAA